MFFEWVAAVFVWQPSGSVSVWQLGDHLLGDISERAATANSGEVNPALFAFAQVALAGAWMSFKKFGSRFLCGWAGDVAMFCAVRLEGHDDCSVCGGVVLWLHGAGIACNPCKNNTPPSTQKQ